MRAGKSLSVSSADIRRLKAVVQDRNAPQKHVWRAEIVLLTADGVGTNEIMRRTAKSKTCVWRWQERFVEDEFDGLVRDKTRPSRIKPLSAEATERVVAFTLGDPPDETTHWGTVKLTEPRARGDEFWSRWASGDGACVGDLAPDSKAAVTRSAAGCSRCKFWIRDVKEVRDLIVNRQEPLRLPG